MNGYQRVAAVFAGRWPDTTPVMLHNFMMAAREAGVTMRQFRTDPEALARSFIEAVERYGYDGIMVDVDTVTLAAAAGVPVDSPEDEPARIRGPLLRSLAEVSDLSPVDILRSPGSRSGSKVSGSSTGTSAARSTSVVTATNARSPLRAWCAAWTRC